jgi:hypothetical protein
MEDVATKLAKPTPHLALLPGAADVATRYGRRGRGEPRRGRGISPHTHRYAATFTLPQARSDYFSDSSSRDLLGWMTLIIPLLFLAPACWQRSCRRCS